MDQTSQIINVSNQHNQNKEENLFIDKSLFKELIKDHEIGLIFLDPNLQSEIDELEEIFTNKNNVFSALELIDLNKKIDKDIDLINTIRNETLEDIKDFESNVNRSMDNNVTNFIKNKIRKLTLQEKIINKQLNLLSLEKSIISQKLQETPQKENELKQEFTEIQLWEQIVEIKKEMAIIHQERIHSLMSPFKSL